MRCVMCKREAASGVMVAGGYWVGPACARRRGLLPVVKARRARSGGARPGRVIVRLKSAAGDGQITFEGFDLVEVVSA